MGRHGLDADLIDRLLDEGDEPEDSVMRKVTE